MPQTATKRDARYTYADYLTWSDDERWELIDGVAYNMTPAPSTAHQRISGKLFYQLTGVFMGKRSKDLKEKFLLYERAGVSEYWVVHPAEQTVMVFRRGPDGAYGRPERYASEDRVPVGILPELEIDLATVFAE